MAGVKAGRRANKAAKAASGVFVRNTDVRGVKRLRNRKGGLLTQVAQAQRNAVKRAKVMVPRGRPGAKNR